MFQAASLTCLPCASPRGHDAVAEQEKADVSFTGDSDGRGAWNVECGS